MNSFYVYKIIISIILSVVFLIDLKCLAKKLQIKQSLSKKGKIMKRIKDPVNSFASENKNHFESKIIVMSAIEDYEIHFTVHEKNQSTIKPNRKSIPKVIDLKDIPENVTLDAETCRKEIRERKQRWICYMKNPPSEKISRLKSRIENKDNQFTVEEFCQAVAILHQRIKDDIHLEAKHLQKAIDNPISKYDRTKFVIPFLLEEYPGEISKALKELIVKELKK